IAGTANAQDIVGGVKTTIEGLAQTTVSATDRVNETSRQGANLSGQSSIYNLNQELNKVRGDFRQNFFDYSMGSRAAALATGGKVGGSIMDNFAADQGDSNGMLGRLQNARIAPQEFTRLTAEAGANQGSMFNTDQIFQARQLE